MYSLREIQKIVDTSSILRHIVYSCGSLIESGHLKTLPEIDNKIKDLCDQNKVRSVIKDHNGFPNYSCISVNNIACHGTTESHKKDLKEGDVVKLDLAIESNGYVSDICRTFFVGEGGQFNLLMYTFNKNLIDQTILHLNKILTHRLSEGTPGITPWDIASYVSKKIEKTINYKGILEYGGHGVGKTLHERPTIPYDPDLCLDRDFMLTNGSVFTIEPIICKNPGKLYLRGGKVKTRILEDKWSVRAKEVCTQHEETVAIINNKIEVLTK